MLHFTKTVHVDFECSMQHGMNVAVDFSHRNKWLTIIFNVANVQFLWLHIVNLDVPMCVGPFVHLTLHSVCLLTRFLASLFFSEKESEKESDFSNQLVIPF
jgi:hypothetical protein